MGLPVSVYRHGKYDCTNGGVSSRVTELTLINVDGPFEPTDKAPAAKLEQGPMNSVRIVPVECEGHWTMFGGNYAACSDSRLSSAIQKLLGHRFYGAVAIHDRVEG